jgi:hypothetical protein
MSDVPRPPCIDKVPSLQYLCSKMIDSKTLIAYNLGHLCIGEPIIKESVLLLPDNFTLVTDEVSNVLAFIIDFMNIIERKCVEKWPPVLNQVRAKDLDARFRVYFSQRVKSANLLNLYEHIDGTIVEKKSVDFIKDLRVMNDYLDNLKKVSNGTRTRVV